MLESNDRIIVNRKADLQYIEFKNLKKYDTVLAHCFTTRLGGVSTGECSTLNLSFTRNDSRSNVIRNYHILADALGVDFDKMVLSNQVHDKKIRYVGAEDAGKGLSKESDIIGYDGLSTDVPGIPLVTFYADCVPVLILDPVKKAITAVHSGWKSTLENISAEAIKLMKERYNSNLKELQIAIGPSICQSCFEVDEGVYIRFINKYPWCDTYLEKKNDKYYINLQQIIKKVLVDEGVPEENILLSDVCTKCNNDVFFSYRGDQRKTGSLVAVMMLK
ncbi:MAG: hypothetical protein K0R50_4083 [Eubacterium sp.]|jgi:YfiH family protein|nr:hypothetical protein [Eubacterium sp.]